MARTEGDSHRRRRGAARFRQRPAAGVARRPTPAAPVPAPAPAGRTSRLTVVMVLCAGVLLGAVIHVLPVGLQRPLELLAAFGLALTATLSYRRWVRGLIEQRRRMERERGE